jgi:hypothetical protein
MPGLCEEFSISRKTGYKKILKRYRDRGVEGLTDRSRRPYRHANQLPLQIETLIVRLKREKPAWGAPKIRERLARLYSRDNFKEGQAFSFCCDAAHAPGYLVRHSAQLLRNRSVPIDADLPF